MLLGFKKNNSCSCEWKNWNDFSSSCCKKNKRRIINLRKVRPVSAFLLKADQCSTANSAHVFSGFEFCGRICGICRIWKLVSSVAFLGGEGVLHFLYGCIRSPQGKCFIGFLSRYQKIVIKRFCIRWSIFSQCRSSIGTVIFFPFSRIEFHADHCQLCCCSQQHHWTRNHSVRGCRSCQLSRNLC